MFCVSRINNLIHMCIYIYEKKCAKSNVHNMINYINTQIDCGKHSVYVDKYTC